MAMYATSVGRVSSKNIIVGREQENTADIPEWKKQLIMRRRSATPASGSDESKTAASSTRSHFSGPFTLTNDSSARRGSVSKYCSGQVTCESAPCSKNNKYSAVRTGEADYFENEKTSPVPCNINSTDIASRKITIGNINVELRNVSKSPISSSDSPEILRSESSSDSRFLFSPHSDNTFDASDEESEDLQYGPGIVDRLRARFLNMGQPKNRRQPVVRKFSSLENLYPRGSVVSGLPFRANGTQARRYGIRTGGASKRCYVKKAQSMETLLVGEMLASGRTSSHPFSRSSNTQSSVSSISPFFCQNEIIDNEKQYLPNTYDDKICRRWEYTRQESAPNIREDELPKPDTVKQVKRIFESPCAERPCHPAVNHRSVINSIGSRPFREKQHSSFTSACTNKLSEKSNSQEKQTARKVTLKFNELDAKPSAKSNEIPIRNGENNSICDKINSVSAPPAAQNEHCVEQKDHEIDKRSDVLISDSLSSHTSSEIPVAQVDCEMVNVNESDAKACVVLNQNNAVEEGDSIECTKVTTEQLPLITAEEPSESEGQSESSQENSEAEQIDEITQEPHPLSKELSSCDGMVVASSRDPEDSSPDATDSSSVSGEIGLLLNKQPVAKKPQGWKKPPPATTSVVFDFRGKDVKPNISLNPAPFGCRPAKITRNSLGRKRAGSPPRSPQKVNGVDGAYSNCNDNHDDEDWDDMDVGADLPALSGIVFAGENIKVGRGALLLKRNKNLTIQFNDEATSTFEYPSEETYSPNSDDSPESVDQDPNHEDCLRLKSSSLKSSLAIGASASSGLSSYTPHVLGSEEFQLGVARPTLRHTSSPVPKKCDSPVTDEIVPANPEETSGWSATETTDILF